MEEPIGWSTDLMDFQKVMEDDVRDLCESKALSFMSEVIRFTPSVSGNLRASWRIAEGAPDVSITTSGKKASPVSPPAVPSSLSNLPKYPIIFVTNNQAYAGLVNDGGPKNVPHFMVEQALDAIFV